MLRLKETHKVESDYCCSRCQSTDLYRLNRCKVWFNHFLFSLWALIGILVLARLFWIQHINLIQPIAIIFTGMCAIFIWRNIIYYFFHESREWVLVCKPCGSKQIISPFELLTADERKEVVLKMFYGSDNKKR